MNKAGHRFLSRTASSTSRALPERSGPSGSSENVGCFPARSCRCAALQIQKRERKQTIMG